MPNHRSIKTIALEAVIFFTVFALFGHLIIHFWERIMIQSELKQMKSSLYSLKITIADIGNVYDKLIHELKGLAETAEKKHAPLAVNEPVDHKKHAPLAVNEPVDHKKHAPLAVNEPVDHKKHAPLAVNEPVDRNKCRSRYTLDRRRLHDIKVKAMIDAKNEANGIICSKTNKTTDSEFIQKKNAGVTTMKNEKYIKNMTTMTRYPPKSTGTGREFHYSGKNYSTQRDSGRDRHECYNEFTCRNEPYINLKF